ncbi:hypothetical protein C5Z26_04095 [Lactobacillus sp. CBA3606]|uniref:EpsG family protein n=1 Tax=Lactobacillus sp. CBA3606 TaxID=2099789 RepID=UPI000CFB6DF5|nr:EpsG family protein [Lactobacillus sp. CBA3606]AVK63329.1 hypothetical protein C5Z26_04095 [Lactobacillus sp. CBA3606]
MELLLGASVFLIGLVCPLLGLLISAPVSFLYNKGHQLIIIIFILLLGYISFFYAPREVDDMSRYMAYMQTINAANVFDYLYKLYSAPFSVQGLNASEWPGSGIVLYFVSKYSSYRVLSATTLVITYASRLVVMKKNYLESKSHDWLKYFLWMIAIFISLQPYLVISGFRWYLSLSVLMITTYFEIHNGFKLRYFWFYILAASFHPAAFIFLFLRIISLMFSTNKHDKKVAQGVIALAVVVSMIEYNRIIKMIVNYFNDFLVYTRSSTDLRKIDNLLYFIILIVILITIIELKRQANFLPILNYLLIIVIFNMLLIDFSVFSRIVQFTIPTSVIILSKVSFLRKKLYWWELLIPVSIIMLSVLNLIIVHYASFPPLLEPLKDILLNPIWSK